MEAETCSWTATSGATRRRIFRITEAVFRSWRAMPTGHVSSFFLFSCSSSAAAIYAGELRAVDAKFLTAGAGRRTRALAKLATGARFGASRRHAGLRNSVFSAINQGIAVPEASRGRIRTPRRAADSAGPGLANARRDPRSPGDASNARYGRGPRGTSAIRPSTARCFAVKPGTPAQSDPVPGRPDKGPFGRDRFASFAGGNRRPASSCRLTGTVARENGDDALA